VLIITNTRSYSAICRYENGLFLGASAITCKGVIDPVVLETLACREALALATDLIRDKIKIASDCKGVVEDILNSSGGRHGYIIRENQIMSREKLSWSSSHEGRSSNNGAHCLAKHALGLEDGRHVWLIYPALRLLIVGSII
jgi:ribonuclease HI